jgi:hypothetical protein
MGLAADDVESGDMKASFHNFTAAALHCCVVEMRVATDLSRAMDGAPCGFWWHQTSETLVP